MGQVKLPGGGGKNYVAGTGISITDNTISNTAVVSDIATIRSNASTGATHASNTSNPHSTTFTQVGGYTALNRSTNVNVADTNYTTIMARGESLNSAETTPAVNGAIAWTYE